MIRQAVVLAAVVGAVDLALRRLGVYAGADLAWPAGWRATRVPASDPEAPYRAAERTAWTRVVPAGVPRATTLFVAPAFAVAAMWSLASLLAVGDVGDVLRGTRGGGRALASFLLCATRGGVAWAVLAAALTQARGRFAAWVAVALGMDLVLATVPVPCSDVRADDVRMALAGISVDGLLALGFGWSVWRRRGLSFTDPAELARQN